MVVGQYNNQPTETKYLDGRPQLQTEQVDLFPSPQQEERGGARIKVFEWRVLLF
jgi:hypothetical protein